MDKHPQKKKYERKKKHLQGLWRMEIDNPAIVCV